MAWTEREIETLQRLRAEGKSFDFIARMMPKRTKNSVLAMGRRLGLTELSGFAPPRVIENAPAPRLGGPGIAGTPCFKCGARPGACEHRRGDL